MIFLPTLGQDPLEKVLPTRADIGVSGSLLSVIE